MGGYLPGVVAVCAWEVELWYQDLSKNWYWERVDVLERLGVDVWRTVRGGWLRGPRTRRERSSS